MPAGRQATPWLGIVSWRRDGYGHFPCWIQRGAPAKRLGLRALTGDRGGREGALVALREAPAWGWKQTLRLGCQREQLMWAEVLGSTGRGLGKGHGHRAPPCWRALGAVGPGLLPGVSTPPPSAPRRVKHAAPQAQKASRQRRGAAG